MSSSTIKYPTRIFHKSFIGIFTLLIAILFNTGCTKAPESSTLEEILKSGEITVITRNNAHCYYFYREQPMGFEYDLAKAFADYLGVNLKVKIAEKWEGMIPELMKGIGDFIAASMTITPARKKEVLFSDGYHEIQQHIIVHRNNSGIKNAENLSGKIVHVRKGTSYVERLTDLKASGIDLSIQLHEDTPTQDLIRQVAEKKIEVTVADSNIAMLNRRYYPRVLIKGPISDGEYLGWAVHPNAKNLLLKINEFFKTIKQNGQFNEIYNRYYVNVELFDYLDIRTFHRRVKTRLPRYTQIIQEEADNHDFDWRLIAAQIYQESHFNPKARSGRGAYGLMQLTRHMASSLGVVDILHPSQNIRAGVKYLRYLYKHYDNADDPDRMFIALAAYNIGMGHMWDARNLAMEMNLDPNKWSSLSKTLPLLRYYKYHKDTKYGYARGTEPIIYVKQIMVYYDILKHQSIEYQTSISHQKKDV